MDIAMKIAFVILMIACVGGLLCSCDDTLDIQQDYDFNITTMLVQKRIKKGETAEIRCQLNKSGNYKEAEFFISYFQPDGKGVLKNDEGIVFNPNDTYQLTRETFRLYYTSQSEDQQVIDLYFFDSFNNQFTLSFSFNNDSDSEITL